MSEKLNKFKEELKEEIKEEIKEEVKEELKIERIKILNNSYEILNKYNFVASINHRHLLKLLIEIINNNTDNEFNKFYYKCLSLFNVKYYHNKDYHFNIFNNHNLLNLYNTPNDFINAISNIFNHTFSRKYYYDLTSYIEKLLTPSLVPAIKQKIWNKYIGEEINKSKCLCCNYNDIKQLSFYCGYIMEETKLLTIKPICSNCNLKRGKKYG